MKKQQNIHLDESKVQKKVKFSDDVIEKQEKRDFIEEKIKQSKGQCKNQLKIFKKRIELRNKVNGDIDGRRWNDQDKDKIIQGKFSEVEVDILLHSLCKYIQLHGNGIKSLEQFVTSNTKSKETYGAWSKIAECLPNRTVQSCHNLIRRKFNPNNYKGKWTVEEEQKLVQFHDGQKPWKDIAQELGRTELNVRDKFKSMGGDNYKLRLKIWKVKEVVQMLKLIQKQINQKFLNDGIFDLENDMIELQWKKNSNQEINKNISKISSFIDHQKLKHLNLRDIKWTQIAETIKTKSKDDCRNLWNQHFLNVVFSKDYGLEEDENLVLQIFKQNPDNDKDIDWSQIDNKRSIKENQNRWINLKKCVKLNPIYDNLEVFTELQKFFDNQKKFEQQKNNQQKPIKSNENFLISTFKNQYMHKQHEELQNDKDN